MDSAEYVNGQIKEIDHMIDHLYNRRMDLSKDLTAIHRRTNQTDIDIAYKKFKRNLRGSRRIVEAPLVVYQGEPGAYSEMACVDFFGEDTTFRGLPHFEDTFRALKAGEADYAVLPIENSSTGAIRQVYDLLMQYECYMVGETTVTVQHSLASLPEATIDDIKMVYSHEQGLFQCEKYLSGHPDWQLFAKFDTAGSAKYVSEAGDIHKAAICSSRAAKLYGLKTLAAAINTNNNNTTRFVVVSPKMELRPQRDKICISITTAHTSGSLHEILTIFAVNGLNLVRLESRPIPQRNWEYMFFIEFTGNLTDPGMDNVIHDLSMISADLRVFGNFKSNLKE